MATSKKSTSKKTSSTALKVSDNMSSSVRKIENGFLISQSGYVKEGKNERYVEKQFFSPTNPLANIKTPGIKFGKK